jgi:glutamyl-Q tRNA(Asp) synthetase
MGYVGRFAPSPSGPLHLGSLTTAIASFLHARQSGGEWLVRIEDIDPPREVPGATDEILRALEAYELHWDRSVLYQSTRIAAFRDTVDRLLASGSAYRCSCSRRTLRDANISMDRYPGFCRDKRSHVGPTAVRMRVERHRSSFEDGIRGSVEAEAPLGDYIVRRRDGLPAYHLAVVLDDAAQGVTDVVRGRDLLESTFAHLHLQRSLGLPPPRYYHLPILVDSSGLKLSKQTGATPVGLDKPSVLASTCLRLLGLSPPADLEAARPSILWSWARNHLRLASLKDREDIKV